MSDEILSDILDFFVFIQIYLVITLINDSSLKHFINKHMNWNKNER